MDIMNLIDRIEEIVENGRGVPFSSSKMVDPEKIFEIIDEIRAQFPDELKQARWIVKERQEMLEEAEKEANRILEEARDRAQSVSLLCEGGGKAIVRERAPEGRDLQLEDGQG